MKPIVEFVSGEGSTNYCMIQMCLFSTPPKLRSLNYYGMVVCTILDSAKWQVAWQTCDSACFVGSPQLCCQSVRDGCKLMLISFCWSAYSNSLQGFPFWYARLPVGYVIEVRRNKKLSFMQGYVGLNPQLRLLPFQFMVGRSGPQHGDLLAKGCCRSAYEKQKWCCNHLVLLGVTILSIWSELALAIQMGKESTVFFSV